eukprot:GHRR01037594.1.p1 GENE.GHRR01037594.1~~GHRR01037594.1.p1  ORF type:complete len:108 (-),score=10.62 GHRR01037594.1:12-335(-)
MLVWFEDGLCIYFMASIRQPRGLKQCQVHTNFANMFQKAQMHGCRAVLDFLQLYLLSSIQQAECLEARSRWVTPVGCCRDAPLATFAATVVCLHLQLQCQRHQQWQN